jgi:hypothetical protein
MPVAAGAQVYVDLGRQGWPRYIRSLIPGTAQQGRTTMDGSASAGRTVEMTSDDEPPEAFQASSSLGEVGVTYGGHFVIREDAGP